MEQTSFRPMAQKKSEDIVARTLLNISQHILVVVCGLSPILFLPLPYIQLGYTKVLMVMVGVVLAILFYSLYLLREGSVSFRLPLAYVAFGLVALVTGISAIFSGDIRDSLMGDFLSVGTAAFVAFLFVIVATLGILRGSKAAILRLYLLLIVSAVVLSIFHLLRLVFGADFLSMGLFSGNVSTPLGAWNDLALFFGLTLLLCMLSLEQLPLTKAGKIAIGVVSGIGLMVLAVINFFAVWLVLGVVSFIVLVFGLTKHRFKDAQLSIEGEEKSALGSILLATLISVVAATFLIAGSSLGGAISQVTGINYIEVRPSFSATFDVARGVLAESPLLGIGPNKFVDGWQLYRDSNINQTIFWNTPFATGNSFLSTVLLETGVLGIVSWIVFLSLLFVSGLRMLFRNSQGDRFWRFIGVSSFVATVYLWGMMAFYVPTSSILMLTAVCTGIFLVTYSTLMPVRTFSLSVTQNRNMSFVFVAGAMLFIVGSVSALYFTTQHFTTMYSFNKVVNTVQAGDTLDDLESNILSLYQQSGNDLFARQIAIYEFARMNTLLSVAEPNEAQRTAFQSALTQSINAAQAAIASDDTDPRNWQVLGEIYSVLSGMEIEGSYDRANNAFATARDLDPINPTYPFLQAQLEARVGNITATRSRAEEALSLRPQYTEAISLLIQVDVIEGKVAEAINRTRAITTLEPGNAVRFYQLGALSASQDDSVGAISAFEKAVSLDENYANARYLLALQYIAAGRTNDAITQLQVVRDLNPENTAVDEIITALESGVPIVTGAAGEVSEPEVVEDGGVTSSDLDSGLVSSVNTPPESDVEEVTEESVAEPENEDEVTSVETDSSE